MAAQMERARRLVAPHVVAAYDALRLYGAGVACVGMGTREFCCKTTLKGMDFAWILPPGLGEPSPARKVHHARYPTALPHPAPSPSASAPRATTPHARYATHPATRPEKTTTFSRYPAAVLTSPPFLVPLCRSARRKSPRRSDARRRRTPPSSARKCVGTPRRCAFLRAPPRSFPLPPSLVFCSPSSGQAEREEMRIAEREKAQLRHDVDEAAMFKVRVQQLAPYLIPI